MSAYFKTLRSFNHNLRLFFTATAVQGFVFFGIYTLLLNLYLLRLGYGPSFIGLVNAAGPLSLALASLPAGLLSRRTGCRKALMLGYFGLSLGLGLLPLSEFLPEFLEREWVLGSYVLAWLFSSLIVVNFSPYLMGATSEDERNHAFSIQNALWPVAGFAGNLVGGLLPSVFAVFSGVDLDSPVPYRNALLIAAAVNFLTLLAMWHTVEVVVNPADEDEHQQKGGGNSSARAPILLIGVIALVWMLRIASEWTMRVYFNVYLDSVLSTPTALIGLLSAAAQLLGFVALFAPAFMTHFGKRRTIVWGLIGAALSFLPLVFLTHWTAVGFGYMVMMAVIALTGPVINVFSQESVLPRWRTTISSAMAMSLGIGIAAIAFGGGGIIIAFGYRTLFVTGALLALLSATVFWTYFGQGELPGLPIKRLYSPSESEAIDSSAPAVSN